MPAPGGATTRSRRPLSQLTHELAVIERTRLSEFFLICWDLMGFAREHRSLPRAGAAPPTRSWPTCWASPRSTRSTTTSSSSGSSTKAAPYPDIDIDFSFNRREEVIQYLYGSYGPDHAAMVCNVITYRARSVVREVAMALGFPRPLVDRVAKALDTRDSVVVRRDLESDGCFAEFFHPPAPIPTSGRTWPGPHGRADRGLTDRMGRLNLPGKPGPPAAGDRPGGARRQGRPGRLDGQRRVAGRAGDGPGRAAAGARPARTAAGTIGGRAIDPESGPPAAGADRAGRPEPLVAASPSGRPRRREHGRPPDWSAARPLCAGSTASRATWASTGAACSSPRPAHRAAPLERATMPGRVVTSSTSRTSRR